MLNSVEGGAEMAYDNQHSGRSFSDPVDVKAANIVIPHDVFYEPNSFRPLPVVDLRDWTEFCTAADSPIVAQIAASLSSQCAELNLSRLSRLSASKGTHNKLQTRSVSVVVVALISFVVNVSTDLANLLTNCCRLERLNLSRFEDIPVSTRCRR